MSELTLVEKSVLDLLPLGNERRTSIKEISSLIDLDERSIYTVVNNLRKKGIPICAIRYGEPTERGYFIATTEEERSDGLASYKAQVYDMTRLIEVIEESDLNGWREKFKGA